MSRDIFKPEAFLIDPVATNYKIDQEVAAKLANTLYGLDIDIQPGNNYGNQAVVIDPSGSTLTKLIREPTDDQIIDYGYRLGFSAPATTDVNEAFTMQMQKALLLGERNNRLGISTSLIGATILGAIPGSFADIALHTSSMDTLNKIRFTGLGLAITGKPLKEIGYHIYRLNMTKEGTHFNTKRLKTAGIIGKSLNLPPVVI